MDTWSIVKTVLVVLATLWAVGILLPLAGAAALSIAKAIADTWNGIVDDYRKLASRPSVSEAELRESARRRALGYDE